MYLTLSGKFKGAKLEKERRKYSLKLVNLFDHAFECSGKGFDLILDSVGDILALLNIVKNFNGLGVCVVLHLNRLVHRFGEFRNKAFCIFK